MPYFSPLTNSHPFYEKNNNIPKKLYPSKNEYGNKPNLPERQISCISCNLF